VWTDVWVNWEKLLLLLLLWMTIIIIEAMTQWDNDRPVIISNDNVWNEANDNTDRPDYCVLLWRNIIVIIIIINEDVKILLLLLLLNS